MSNARGQAQVLSADFAFASPAVGAVSQPLDVVMREPRTLRSIMPQQLMFTQAHNAGTMTTTDPIQMLHDLVSHSEDVENRLCQFWSRNTQVMGAFCDSLRRAIGASTQWGECGIVTVTSTGGGDVAIHHEDDKGIAEWENWIAHSSSNAMCVFPSDVFAVINLLTLATLGTSSGFQSPSYTTALVAICVHYRSVMEGIADALTTETIDGPKLCKHISCEMIKMVFNVVGGYLVIKEPCDLANVLITCIQKALNFDGLMKQALLKDNAAMRAHLHRFLSDPS
jgi:hypothetical protein